MPCLRYAPCLSLAVLTLLAGRGLADDARDDSQKSDDGKKKAIELFDGKSLDGWTTQSGEPISNGWQVVDGELTRTSRGGAIYAQGEYEDFILSFEWRIAPRVNSGIKYRVRFYEKGVRGNPGWLGCEYQIYDEARKPNPRNSTGALYDLFEPNDKKRVNPPGKYNRSRIVVLGTRFEHWLNGEKVVEADTASEEWKKRIADSKFAPVKDFAQNRRGRIQVQDHGGQVWFRRITLTPLGKNTAESLATSGESTPAASQ